MVNLISKYFYLLNKLPKERTIVYFKKIDRSLHNRPLFRSSENVHTVQLRMNLFWSYGYIYEAFKQE